MSKFGWDLPPGVTTSMLPGNSREEGEAEAMMDAIYDILEKAVTEDEKATALYGLVSEAYQKGRADARVDEQMAMSPLHDEIISAIHMFKCIEINREMPAFANIQQQYVAMGKQLEAVFYQCTGLEKVESESR